jgi:hypothetical protein
MTADVAQAAELELVLLLLLLLLPLLLVLRYCCCAVPCLRLSRLTCSSSAFKLSGGERRN